MNNIIKEVVKKVSKTYKHQVTDLVDLDQYFEDIILSIFIAYHNDTETYLEDVIFKKRLRYLFERCLEEMRFGVIRYNERTVKYDRIVTELIEKGLVKTVDVVREKKSNFEIYRLTDGEVSYKFLPAIF